MALESQFYIIINLQASYKNKYFHDSSLLNLQEFASKSQTMQRLLLSILNPPPKKTQVKNLSFFLCYKYV